ncbi:MAG TPA: hypothetical protein VD793_07835, partial [Gemmatimonadales bacterium]|nr:hypothetical protein [Gemmatimonadales bacterium]
RQEFEPYGPTRMTDVLRRMPGISVRPNPDYGRPDPVTGLRDTRQYLINSNRIPEIQANVCASVVFLDGAYVGNTRTVDLDNYLNMDFVDAIEAYSGAGNVPAEFNRQGAECGVIAAWSRTSVDVGPALSAHLDLGGQLGGRVSGEGLEDGRLGMQAVVSFAGLFEFYPAVNLLVGWSVGSASAQRTGWQFLAGLRTRPLGRGSPWYLGAGYTVLDFRETGNPLTDPELEEGRAVLLTGTTFAAGWLRPFVELQVLDPFQRAGRQVHAFTGLTFRAY